MTTFEPQTQLSFEILEAIIRKTGFALRNSHSTFYECETFTWSPGSKTMPTLSIITGNEELPVAYLYWNGELTDRFEVHSNIPWSAEDKINVYISVEQAVYSELANIVKEDLHEIIIPEKYQVPNNEERVIVEFQPAVEEPRLPTMHEEH